MIELAESLHGLSIRIFSGLIPGLLGRLLADPAIPAGTLISDM